MSHRPQRTEKDCLNCGTQVAGHFCQNCGQENVVPKETFWAMLLHFVYDITHFDGKFFETLKTLLRKPGFLSVEYMKGRRASYLNPIRMYIFTSAFFFLVFFSLSKPEDIARIDEGQTFTQVERDSILKRIERNDYRNADPAVLERARKMLADTSIALRSIDLLGLDRNFVAMATLDRKYLTMTEYDSIQKALPASDRDGWFKRIWNKRAIEVNTKYRNDPTMSWKKMSDILLHKLPYLLFISLPFFALLLKWLYYRRKDYIYADHGIFTIHHYIVSFILLLFVFLWDKLEEVSGWSIFNLLMIFSVLAIPIYLYKGMRRFYGQGRGKTILKFLLLNFSALFLMVLLMTFFVIFSVFTL